MSFENELGSRYFWQADVTSELSTKYYEACFTKDGVALDPDEPNIERASAADRLFFHVKDLYEETLGCEIQIKIIQDKNDD